MTTVNCTVISSVFWKPEIGEDLKSYSELKYTDSVSLSQPRWMVVPLGKFLTQVGLCGGAHNQWKINITFGFFKEKKQKISRIQRLRQQTSWDSLSLNLWRISTLLNLLFSYRKVISLRSPPRNVEKKDKEQQFSFGIQQLEAEWKHSQNEDFPHYKM